MGKYQKVYFKAKEKQEFFPWQPEMKSYEIIDSSKKLRRLARKLKDVPFFAFDTETTGIDCYGPNSKFNCVSIQISYGEYNNYYLPLHHRRVEDYDRNLDEDDVVEYLTPIFANPDLNLAGSNLKFDRHVLKRIGIDIKTTNLWDTMIMSWLCDENTPNGLKENSAMKLGIDQEHFREAVETVPNDVKKEFGLKASNKATFDMVLIDDAAEYGLGDSFYSFVLAKGFIKLLEKEGMMKIYQRHYQPFIDVLFTMEERGVTIDRKQIERMSVDIEKDVKDLEYKMYEIAGIQFNPGSSQHLYELFFGFEKPAPTNKDGSRKKLKNGQYAEAKVNWDLINASFNFKVLSYTKGGLPATDNDAMWKISQMTFKNRRKQEGVELAKLLLEYKKLAKLKDAFVTGLTKQIYDDGKIHCSFNIIGADSGRLSCSSPNLDDEKLWVCSCENGSDSLCSLVA